jgi:dipeptide/tripeptide permease
MCRAIGIGAVQANMAVFGAEQIQDSKLAARYFDKYFVAVNIGATIATLSIPLIQNDSDDQITTTNYFYGYLTAIFMLISAVILFLIGYRYYIHIPSVDSVILKYIPVIINAFQTRRRYKKIRRDSHINGSTLSEERSNQEETLSFLDYANSDNQGRFNEQIISDVKAFQRAVIVFLLLIPYWIIYYQVYDRIH